MSNTVSPMSDAFHEWLNQCPTNWYREKVTDRDVHYSFDIDVPEDDDEEEEE